MSFCFMTSGCISNTMKGSLDIQNFDVGIMEFRPFCNYTFLCTVCRNYTMFLNFPKKKTFSLKFRIVIIIIMKCRPDDNI